MFDQFSPEYVSTCPLVSFALLIETSSSSLNAKLRGRFTSIVVALIATPTIPYSVGVLVTLPKKSV